MSMRGSLVSLAATPFAEKGYLAFATTPAMGGVSRSKKWAPPAGPLFQAFVGAPSAQPEMKIRQRKTTIA